MPPALSYETLQPISSGMLLLSLALYWFRSSVLTSPIALPFFLRNRRIRKILPHVVELLEFSTANEFRRVGLRIAFPETLHPTVFVCKNEVYFHFPSRNSQPVGIFQCIINFWGTLQISSSTRYPFLIYAVTSSGVAYCLKLRNISSYVSYSVIPLDEVVEFNLQTHPDNKPVTCVSAISGCLVIGRNDGSVSCYKLGSLDQHTPGMSLLFCPSSGYIIYCNLSKYDWENGQMGYYPTIQIGSFFVYSNLSKYDWYNLEMAYFSCQ